MIILSFCEFAHFAATYFQASYEELNLNLPGGGTRHWTGCLCSSFHGLNTVSKGLFKRF